MMIKKIFGILFLVIVIGGWALLNYTGYFTKIVIQEKEMGPYTFIYQEFTGDYALVGSVINDLYKKLADEDQIKIERGFGIYYDNPAVVEKDKLRSDLGVILEDTYRSELSVLQSKYKVKTWDKQKALVIEFPYKNQLSILAGVMKVYPELKKYVAEKKYAQREIMEIYDMTAKKIYYVMSIQ